MCSGEIDLLLS